MFHFITAGLNVSQISPDRIQAQGDDKQLDLVLIPNKQGRNQFNRDGFIVEDAPREDRDEADRGAILGNFRLFPEESTLEGTILLQLQLHRIDKQRLVQGQKGKYLDFVAFPNREGRDDHGNDGVVVQSVSKEEREAGQRGPILGNFRLRPGKRVTGPVPSPGPAVAEVAEKAVPF